MSPDEYEAVKAVLLDRLETTEDEELQAALWQLLLDHDQLEKRRILALVYLSRGQEV